MSDSAEREWRFYVDDLLAAAEKVLRYSAKLWSIVSTDVPSLVSHLRTLRAAGG
jgi:uncharacterized protein with HEPN domain